MGYPTKAWFAGYGGYGMSTFGEGGQGIFFTQGYGWQFSLRIGGS